MLQNWSGSTWISNHFRRGHKIDYCYWWAKPKISKFRTKTFIMSSLDKTTKLITCTPGIYVNAVCSSNDIRMMSACQRVRPVNRSACVCRFMTTLQTRVLCLEISTENRHTAHPNTLRNRTSIISCRWFRGVLYNVITGSPVWSWWSIRHRFIIHSDTRVQHTRDAHANHTITIHNRVIGFCRRDRRACGCDCVTCTRTRSDVPSFVCAPRASCTLHICIYRTYLRTFTCGQPTRIATFIYTISMQTHAGPARTHPSN